MRPIIYIIFFVLFFAQTACAQKTDSTFHDIDKTTSFFYFYRPFKILGMAIKYDIYLNENNIGKLGIRQSCKAKITQTREVEVWARTEISKGFKINVEPGASYYIKCGISWGLFVGRPKLKLIPPEIGKLEYYLIENKLSAREYKNRINLQTKP